MNRAPAGLTRRQLLIGVAFAAVSLGLLYILLPAIAGLGDTWSRLNRGEPGWLTAGLILEIASFFCYVALFRGVIGHEAGIGWAQSYRITLAGLAATRLLAAGGIGGIALTAWALRRDGLPAPFVALRMATLMVLLYSVYMGAVVLTGLGLRIGILSGPSPLAFTLIPAAVAGLIIVACLLIGYFGGELRETTKRLRHPSRSERWRAALATVPNTLAGGVRGAIEILGERPLTGVWAIGWWAFDIAVLWACLHAFGTPPPAGVIVASYFVGHDRQPAPPARRDRRGRGRHDRLADRLRRPRRPRDRRRPLLPRLLVLAADDPGRDRLRRHPAPGARHRERLEKNDRTGTAASTAAVPIPSRYETILDLARSNSSSESLCSSWSFASLASSSAADPPPAVWRT